MTKILIKPKPVATGMKFGQIGECLIKEAADYVEYYASRNYNCMTEAWDHVLECVSRAELEALVKGCKTQAGVISKVRCELMLPLLAERRNEMLSMEF